MLLTLQPDQAFFRETTARFLKEHAPVGELRRLRHDPVGFSPDYWRRGADLGWTSLLVSEEHGGGSISETGLVDLTLVAHELGCHAAPGPFIPTNVVAATLSANDQHLAVLAELLAGTATAAWCFTEPRPHDGLGEVTCDIRIIGDDVVLDGVKRPVEGAGSAGVLLVTGRTDDGLTQVLVPRATPGVSVQPMHTVDLTRRFSVVTLDDVHLSTDAIVGAVGAADQDVDRMVQLAVVLSCAESVGAMQAAFEMTVEWAFDRYTFGRPLASYQELKHRFADMKSWLEASHAITDDAAAAVAARAADADELVSAAKAYISQYGPELVHDCVQIHGGIGLTFEHDIHLFVRRVVLNAALFGTASEHRQRIAAIIERREVAA